MSEKTAEKFIPEKDSMERRLTGIVLFRMLMITVLLGATAILDHHSNDIWTVSQYSIIMAIGIIYVMSILYSLAIKYNSNYMFQATAQIFVDLLLWSFLVYLTGGIHSPFTFLYAVSIIHGGLLLQRKGAFGAALASGLLLMMVLVLDSYGLFHEMLGLSALTPEISDPQVIYKFFLNATMFTLIALLAAYLVEQIRQKEEVLAHRELSLKEQRIFNRSLVSSLHSGFMLTDRNGIVTFANQAIEECTGWRVPEIIGNRLEVIFPGLIDVLQLELTRQPWERKFETLVENSSGEKRWLAFSFNDLINLENEFDGLIIVTDDITSRRDLESELRKSEKLAAVGSLAAGIAHEIRNPLASISGSIQMLNAELSLADDNAKLMDIIMREVERLNTLITEFLEYARPKPLVLETVSLREIIEDIISLLQRHDIKKKIRFRVEFASELFELFGDSTRLRQMIWNILKNCVDATEQIEIPVIWISVSNHISSSNNRRMIRIRISDNGEGMSKQSMKQMFDPFYTTKAGGTGLGMSTVFQIIEMHRGRINVESELGRGTAFTIDIPAELKSLDDRRRDPSLMALLKEN